MLLKIQSIMYTKTWAGRDPVGPPVCAAGNPAVGYFFVTAVRPPPPEFDLFELGVCCVFPCRRTGYIECLGSRYGPATTAMGICQGSLASPPLIFRAGSDIFTTTAPAGMFFVK